MTTIQAKTIDDAVDFHTENYLVCERKHIEHLYENRPIQYRDLNKSAFIEDVYIKLGLAENYRKYWFGERHLIREIQQ